MYVEEISEYSGPLYVKAIYASSASYAIKYAKAKNIPYVETDAITIKVNTKFTKTASSKAQTFKLNAKAENASLTYSSDNKSVKVDKNGKVVAVGKGACTVTVTAANGVKAEIAILVAEKAAEPAKGCLGSVGASILGVIALAGAAFVVAKRKKD